MNCHYFFLFYFDLVRMYHFLVYHLLLGHHQMNYLSHILLIPHNLLHLYLILHSLFYLFLLLDLALCYHFYYFYLFHHFHLFYLFHYLNFVVNSHLTLFPRLYLFEQDFLIFLNCYHFFFLLFLSVLMMNRNYILG